MKYLIPAMALFILSCSDEPIEVNDPSTPIIQSEAIYGVTKADGLKYAEGLTHDDWNSDNSQVFPLVLDAYIPDNDETNRPAILYIHGGGFSGGSRKGSNAVKFGEYFASRGWVFFSIEYRLRGDRGTIPAEWLNFELEATPQEQDQLYAMYPAHRDAKAALRWLVAHTEDYGINPDYITVGGGSAGAITAIGISISDPDDFTTEIGDDPTLSSTNLGETYKIRGILDFWGSKVSLDVLEALNGNDRFDRNDPPLFIAHGTEDPTVLFSNAEDLKSIYDNLGIPITYHPLEGKGHGVWGAEVDGRTLEELAFDFMVEQMELEVR